MRQIYESKVVSCMFKLLLFKVIVARFGHDICHAPCHFWWKFTCKMPDAPDTTSIDHGTSSITVRTPIAFLVAILVVLVLILHVLMFLLFLLLLFLQGCCWLLFLQGPSRIGRNCLSHGWELSITRPLVFVSS